MPTCFLHIGAHKTGTTAIQWFAHENRDVLAQYKVLYPQTGANRTGSHLPLLRHLFGRDEILPGNRQRDTGAQLPLMRDWLGRPGIPPSEEHRRLFEAELQSHNGMDILISAEDLENRVLLSTFDEVVSRFRTYDYDIHVIMYVRNQPQYINSRYVQKVKVWNLNVEFNDFVARDMSDRALRYSTFADEMQRLGVRFTARPYNEAVRKRGIVWDLLGQVVRAPVDQSLFSPPRRANVSLGPVAVAAIRTMQDRLNEHDLRLDHQQRIACKALFHNETKGPRWKEERSFCGLDTALAQRIESAFAEENDAFAHQVFDADWRTVFAEDVGRTYERNTFDPHSASDSDLQLFEEILEEVWPKVLAIATVPRPPRDPSRRLAQRTRPGANVISRRGRS